MTILTAKAATDKFKPGPLQDPTPHPTDSAAYMSVSAGQYATVDRFAFTQKLFGERDYFDTTGARTYSNFTQKLTDFIADTGRPVTLQEILTSTNLNAKALRLTFDIISQDFTIGLTQPHELMRDFTSGKLNKSDFTDLTYVYGTSSFSLEMGTTVSVLAG